MLWKKLRGNAIWKYRGNAQHKIGRNALKQWKNKRDCYEKTHGLLCCRKNKLLNCRTASKWLFYSSACRLYNSTPKIGKTALKSSSRPGQEVAKVLLQTYTRLLNTVKFSSKPWQGGSTILLLNTKRMALKSAFYHCKTALTPSSRPWQGGSKIHLQTLTGVLYNSAPGDSKEGSKILLLPSTRRH